MKAKTSGGKAAKSWRKRNGENVNRKAIMSKIEENEMSSRKRNRSEEKHRRKKNMAKARKKENRSGERKHIK